MQTIKITNREMASALAEHLAEKGKIVEIRRAGKGVELKIMEVRK